MTREDAQWLQLGTECIWGAELGRVHLHLDHQFEAGYAPVHLDALTLEFRRPAPRASATTGFYSSGSLRIDTTVSGLRLELGETALAADSDPHTTLLRELPRLLGDTLERFEVAAPAGDTTLRFRSGRVILCFPCVSAGEVWRLERPDGDAVTLACGTEGRPP